MSRSQPPRPGSAVRAAVVGIVLALLVVGSLAWYLLVKHPRDTERSRSVTAEKPTPGSALDPDVERRSLLFGERATGPGITWRPTGLGYRINDPGTGGTPTLLDSVRIRYVGKLKDGRVFDRAETPVLLRVNGVVPGLSTALQLLKPGGRMEVFVPPRLGYGAHEVAGIPPNSGLIFDVELIAVEKP